MNNIWRNRGNEIIDSETFLSLLCSNGTQEYLYMSMILYIIILYEYIHKFHLNRLISFSRIFEVAMHKILALCTRELYYMGTKKKKKEEKNQKIFIHEYVLFSSSFLIIFRSFG